MRKKITTQWINFDFYDFKEENFNILRKNIFPKISQTNSALIEHLINLECYLLNFKSDNFLEKLNFLKKEFKISKNTTLIEFLFKKNLERFKKKPIF